MRFAVLAGLALASCYSPTAPANVPCPDNVCPSDQTCIAGYCRGGGDVEDASAGRDTPDPGGDAVDAPTSTCIDGDDACLVECVDRDTDCVTTCGDGRCVGNAGELCGNCNADCKTLTPVCGNGACDPGESPDCYADCGPVPWTWVAEELAVIDMINAHRTNGTMCPGSNTTLTAPPLNHAAAMDPQLHEWAWEIAHGNVITMGGGACNGRTNADRQMPVDFDAFVQSKGRPSGQDAVAAWFASSTACPILMSTARTRISIGIAYDVAKGHVAALE